MLRFCTGSVQVLLTLEGASGPKRLGDIDLWQLLDELIVVIWLILHVYVCL